MKEVITPQMRDTEEGEFGEVATKVEIIRQMSATATVEFGLAATRAATIRPMRATVMAEFGLVATRAATTRPTLGTAMAESGLVAMREETTPRMAVTTVQMLVLPQLPFSYFYEADRRTGEPCTSSGRLTPCA